ncbi:minor capsid protein [Ruminococcaceae bacterium OttesenSCG-928-D13]|nr:minor capsid protein [Ruminococcaceae bacterium OttesenSCG-928-D13]
MPVSISIALDKAAVAAKVAADKKRALILVTNEFVKDANYYCKEQTGELERSALRASNYEKGEAVWNTPYAKRQYYTGQPSHDKNPNAEILWAHKAHAEHNAKYQGMIQDVVDGKV